MAPKSKKAPRVDENGVLLVPVPKSISNKEHLQRLNYLFQLSVFHTISNEQDKNNALARMYAKNVDLIQKKTKSALTPSLKRKMCKQCQRILVPTKTVTQEITNESKSKKPNNRVLVSTCICGKTTRFPFGKNPNYRPYAERAGNLTFLQEQPRAG